MSVIPFRRPSATMTQSRVELLRLTEEEHLEIARTTRTAQIGLYLNGGPDNYDLWVAVSTLLEMTRWIVFKLPQFASMRKRVREAIKSLAEDAPDIVKIDGVLELFVTLARTQPVLVLKGASDAVRRPR